MANLCDRLVAAFEDGSIVEALDPDEAMLGILYAASGNQVLVEGIRRPEHDRRDVRGVMTASHDVAAAVTARAQAL